MKTILGFVLLCVLLSLFSAPVFSAPPTAPPPPPPNWWELQYWQCDPLSCESNGGPWSTGSVSTTATGPCFRGYQVEVGAGAEVVNCNPPLFLSSQVKSVVTSLGYVYLNKV